MNWYRTARRSREEFKEVHPFARSMSYANSWYKLAQIWVVDPGDNGIEDKIANFYELEYKYSMLKSHHFLGVEERRQNIESNLEQNLRSVLDEIKEILVRVFGRWLEFHALLSPDTWANKRAEQYADGLDTLSSYQSMVWEYVKYALNSGETRINRDEKAPDRYFSEILNKASKNLRYFPYLSKIFEGGLYEYKDKLLDELNSEGLKKFSDRYGRKFKNQDQAENWINNLTVNKVDPEILFYYDSIDGFVNIAKNLGYENEILAELYKKFVFPYWAKYWKEQGIADTRKKIVDVYKQLQGININDTKNAIVVINMAISSVHQNGSMLDYIAEEAGGSGSAEEMKLFLDDMSGGKNVAQWFQQLKEIGVKI